jgi:3-oxoadipate enol-lactonase
MTSERMVDIGRGRVRLYETGEGACVLFLHAFPLGGAMWAPQLDRVPAGWRFLAPDLRGFGGSDRGVVPDATGATSLDDHVVDVRDLLGALGVRDAVIVGLSMGGYVAQAFVRHARQGVRALVLCDTRSEGDTAEARENRTRMRAAIAAEGARAAGTMIAKLLGPSTRRDHPQLQGRVRELIERNAPGGLDDALVALLTRPDMTPWLREIECPVQVIVGEEDEVSPVAVHRRMQREIRGASLATIPRAGHLSNLEQPEAFNELLHRFLAGLT